MDSVCGEVTGRVGRGPWRLSVVSRVTVGWTVDVVSQSWASQGKQSWVWGLRILSKVFICRGQLPRETPKYPWRVMYHPQVALWHTGQRLLGRWGCLTPSTMSSLVLRGTDSGCPLPGCLLPDQPLHAGVGAVLWVPQGEKGGWGWGLNSPCWVRVPLISFRARRVGAQPSH